MGLTPCPHCRFTQVAPEKCLPCSQPLPKPVARRSRQTAGDSLVPAPPRSVLSLTQIGSGAGILLLLAVFITLLLRRSPSGDSQSQSTTPVSSGAPTLNLTGRWYGQVSDTLPQSPPRPVVKEATIETDRNGKILAARVVLTDPGRGGAGAGYRTVLDGAQRIDDAVGALAGAPGGAPVNVDFISFAPWMPER